MNGGLQKQEKSWNIKIRNKETTKCIWKFHEFHDEFLCIHITSTLLLMFCLYKQRFWKSLGFAASSEWCKNNFSTIVNI